MSTLYFVGKILFYILFCALPILWWRKWLAQETKLVAEKEAQLIREFAESTAAVDALFDFLELDTENDLEARKIFSPDEILGIVESYGITILEVSQLMTRYREILDDDDKKIRLGAYITQVALAQNLSLLIDDAISRIAGGGAEEQDNYFMERIAVAMEMSSEDAETNGHANGN